MILHKDKGQYFHQRFMLRPFLRPNKYARIVGLNPNSTNSSKRFKRIGWHILIIKVKQNFQKVPPISRVSNYLLLPIPAIVGMYIISYCKWFYSNRRHDSTTIIALWGLPPQCLPLKINKNQRAAESLLCLRPDCKCERRRWSR